MKRNVKKLVLNQETVRTLQDMDLKQVAGGDGGRLGDARTGGEVRCSGGTVLYITTQNRSQICTLEYE